jgi:acetoin:2,6-dichlorophenolindophenol oxidoreductase subunit beta
MHKISYLEAAREAIYEEMVRDEKVFVLGEDVGSNLYGATAGLATEFGSARVRNAPISEAAIAGAAIGSAMVGMRPIADFNISSFLYVAMDQIVSMAAKSTYLYGGQAKVPMVMRACMFYGKSVAAQHSDRPYATFATIPGLKIVVPSTAHDVKGLYKTAIRDDNPVMIFEDANLWGTAEEIPDGDYLVPFGQADVKREGGDVTVVALAGAVHHALHAADLLAVEGIAVEVVDPRTVRPLDMNTILTSVAKTHRVVVADPAHRLCSVASEIAASIAEEAFWDLEAPIKRVTSPDSHPPFSPPIEMQLYPSSDRIVAAIRAVLDC